MLTLSDPKWKTLKGGYKVPYDASAPLARLERGEDVWEELWEELHHQGDVGEASYASVPHIVQTVSGQPERDWQPYALLSTIEVQRHMKRNPALPAWLAESYHFAWDQLLSLALVDLRTAKEPVLVRSLLGAVALARGALPLGSLLSALDESEISELLEERYGAPER